MYVPLSLVAAVQVGWFPSYTITEDYALSMELKAAGCKGRYLPEYLAVSRVHNTGCCLLPLAHCLLAAVHRNAAQWYW